MKGYSSDLAFEPHTLIDVLRWRALEQPDQRGYTFLEDGEDQEKHLSYSTLDQHARVVGATLQALGAKDERVLLLYPSGLEYVAGFFGCLYANALAVPVYPPKHNRSVNRLQAITLDAQAKFALTTSQVLLHIQRHFTLTPELESLHWITTDTLDAAEGNNWQEPEVAINTPAFLQYTSGSTGNPKGVMVSHGNLIHNITFAQDRLKLNARSLGVSWLPIFHDVGLIGGLLLPLYTGFPVILMTPAHFLQHPFRWLQAITKYKGTISFAPNFAYDLCTRKVSPEEHMRLDLSSWQVAVNGSEPVRAQSLERFAEVFGPRGFARSAFVPSYGLAEATVFVSSSKKEERPIILTIDKLALEQNKVIESPAGDRFATESVGCGCTAADQAIVIVDPVSMRKCPEDEVGEIWIVGPSVAQGYWKRSVETSQTFQAYIAGTNEGPFLRTGDMGFFRDDELFVSGRLKDLIIIRGNNHYPQDIELTVEQCHPILRCNCGAAFAVDVADEERLVVVQEVERQHRNVDLRDVMLAIRRALAERHELEVYCIVLIRPGSLPKTSSGKIQRRACREDFLDHRLQVISQWTQPLDNDGGQFELPLTQREDAENALQDATAIQEWLVSQLAIKLQVQPQTIDAHAPFASYGLDSLQAVNLSGELERRVGRRLSPTLLWEYPNIQLLSQYLAYGPSAPPSDGQLEAKLSETRQALEGLTQEELAMLLAQELTSLQEEELK